MTSLGRKRTGTTTPARTRFSERARQGPFAAISVDLTLPTPCIHACRRGRHALPRQSTTVGDCLIRPGGDAPHDRSYRLTTSESSVAQQIPNATAFGVEPHFVARDRDDKFGRDFHRAAQGVGAT